LIHNKQIKTFQETQIRKKHTHEKKTHIILCQTPNTTYTHKHSRNPGEKNNEAPGSFSRNTEKHTHIILLENPNTVHTHIHTRNPRKK
jgi:hypothetical protein